MKKQGKALQIPTTFKIYPGKMVMVITALKIGTQFLNEWFQTKPFEVQANWREDGSVFFVLNDEENDYTIKGVEKLTKIFTGKERGVELLVLTRDPLKRYVSAINQDYIKPIFKSNNASAVHTQIMMEYIFKDTTSYINFPYTPEERMGRYLEIYRNRQHSDVQTNDDYIKAFPKDYLEFLCFNVISRVISQPNYEVFRGHNSEWNTPLLQILNFVKNKNQIRVIDIDNQNLSAALSKYEIGTKSLDPIHTSKNLKPIITKIINTLDIGDEFNSELLSYNILKLNWGDKNL